jgi:DNA-binding GntR family transcriptional regulator
MSELEIASSSRGDFAYESLRAAIQQGEIQPGERLREVELAGRLGVSRTPVREALKRLEAEGLVAFAPRRGLVVAQLDQQQVHELYALREVLEGAAAALAARHASEYEIEALQDLVRRHEEAGRNTAQLVEINRHFHATLYSAARNRYLLEALSSMHGSLALLRETTYAAAGRPAAALDEHREIARAIRWRDAASAEEAARRHIRNAEQARLALLFHSAGQ